MADQSEGAVKGTAKKLIKRFGWGYLLELIPGIGFLVPGDIILVWRTLEGDLIGPEGVLLMPIAIFTYGLKLILGIIEIWFDLGIFTTLITWGIAGFFAAWIYMRGSGSTKSNQTKEKSPAPQKTPTKIPAAKK